MIMTAHSTTAHRLLAERRASLRFPSDWTATCYLAGLWSGMEWPARIRDVCDKGIGLFMERSLPVGTLMTVVLESPGGEPVRAVARVIYVQSEGPDECFVGCAFASRFSPQVLDTMQTR